jgi:hypothetical protein
MTCPDCGGEPPLYIERSEWTVGALIYALHQFPDDAPVRITNSIGTHDREVLAVANHLPNGEREADTIYVRMRP